MDVNDLIVSIQASDPYSYLLLQLLQQAIQSGFSINIATPLIVAEASSDFASGGDLRQPYFLHDIYHILAMYPSLKFPQQSKIPWNVDPNSPISIKDRSPFSLSVSNLLLHYAKNHSSVNNSKHNFNLKTESLSFLSKCINALSLFWIGNKAGIDSLLSSENLIANVNETTLAGVSKQLDENMTVLQGLGHYQGAMVCSMGEWFWGVDRFHFLISRLIAGGYGPSSNNSGIILPIPRQLPILPKDKKFDINSAPTLELFFSFRSPYSYLCLSQIKSLQEKFRLKLKIRIVLPMVLRGLPVPLAKRLYIVKDCFREANFKGIPFGNMIDPLENVTRLLGIYSYAASLGKELDYISSVAKGVWAEGKDAGNDSHVQQLCENAGLKWSECQKYLKDESYKPIVEENRNIMTNLGMWGVPSFNLYTTDADKPLFSTWGQDRISFIDALLTDLLYSIINSSISSKL